MQNTDKNLMISIITPSYNQGSFIEDTILSVKNQDYLYVEHIIMDAGSKDNTMSIIHKYDGTYDLRWVSEPDRGQSDALNKGINIAKGCVIGWLNSDDVYMFKDTIGKIMKIFVEEKDIDVVFGDMAFINKSGEVQTFYAHQAFDHKKIINGRQTLGQPAVFFRKKVLIDNPLNVDFHFAMDFDLWTRIGDKYIFKHLSDPVACPRIYPETKTGTQVVKKTGNIFSEERGVILARFGEQDTFGYFVNIYDKITRGGVSRIKGLFYLISNKYFLRRHFAFNGKYKKFPKDIIQQLFLNPLSKYLYK